jgi:hypothetical protein
MNNVWKVTSNNKYYEDIWPELNRDGCIAVGWDDVGDFRQYQDDQALLDALGIYREGNGALHQIKSFRGVLRNGEEGMDVGDIVLATEGFTRVNGVGRITSGYLSENDPDNPRQNHERGFRNVRMVEWLWARNDARGIQVFEIHNVIQFAFQTVTHAGVKIVRGKNGCELQGQEKHIDRFNQVINGVGLTVDNLCAH